VYECGALGQGQHVTIRLYLSWHRHGDTPIRHRIDLLLAQSDGPWRRKGEGWYQKRVKCLPTDGNRGRLVITLGPSQFPLSIDNLIGAMQFRAKGTGFVLHQLTVSCLDGAASSVFQARREISARNSTEFGTTEFHGAEYTAVFGEISDPTAGGRSRRAHYNVYLPEDLFNEGEGLTGPELATWAHSNGGLLALNHPFGAGLQGARVADRTQHVAQHLISSDALGVDLLEVGYVGGRGGMPFHEHLGLWDLLLANRGVLPTVRTIRGLGVSDAHGPPPEGEQTRVCTWILPVDGRRSRPSQAQSVEQMRGGRMFFGQYERFPADGYMDFTLGDEPADPSDPTPLRMGDEGIAPTADPNETPLRVFMNAPGVTGEVRIIRGELNQGPTYEAILPTVAATANKAADQSELEFAVDTSTACFFRVELWQPGEVPVVFSNPIISFPASG
jgi:hypothetical protein